MPGSYLSTAQNGHGDWAGNFQALTVFAVKSSLHDRRRYCCNINIFTFIFLSCFLNRAVQKKGFHWVPRWTLSLQHVSSCVIITASRANLLKNFVLLKFALRLQRTVNVSAFQFSWQARKLKSADEDKEPVAPAVSKFKLSYNISIC